MTRATPMDCFAALAMTAEGWALVAFALIASLLAPPALAQAPRVVGDGMPEPLVAGVADAARGRAIVASRQKGLCLLCHAAPIPEERFQGDLAPGLAGVGARLTPAQLRLRLVDARLSHAQTIMPPYYSSEGLTQVGRAYAGRTILSAAEIEDVVAYLATLRN